MSNMNKKQTFYQSEWVDEIPCNEFVEWVTDYLEDKLSDDDRKHFDAHLAQCPGCPHYLEQIRETIRVAGTLTEELIEPQAKQELMHVFQHWKSGKQ